MRHLESELNKRRPRNGWAFVVAHSGLQRKHPASTILQFKREMEGFSSNACDPVFAEMRAIALGLRHSDLVQQRYAKRDMCQVAHQVRYVVERMTVFGSRLKDFRRPPHPTCVPQGSRGKEEPLEHLINQNSWRQLCRAISARSTKKIYFHQKSSSLRP